jgi:ribose/xylose/arabinose/galactoside ABC-type transport system permease subunit
MKKIIQLLSNRVIFLLFLLAIVMIVMSLISPYFLNIDNLITMARFGAVLALVGLGQSLVILAGGAGIDLSVGSMISLSGVLFGFMVTAGMNVWLSAFLAVLIGGVLGAVNGVTIALWGLPPLIGTLGTMYAYGALALVMTKGVPISGFPDSFSFLANGKVLGLPSQIMLVVLPAFLVLLFIMRRTDFGRWIYLVGVNENAAQFSGIQTSECALPFMSYRACWPGLER